MLETHRHEDFVLGSVELRTHTTIGVEQALNPLLGLDENAFVETMVERSASIGRPPYFGRMEQMNLKGARFDERGVLPPLAPGRVEELSAGGALVIDTRDVECFLAAHVPEALALPSEMIGTWAGWFVSRMGFDDIGGFLGGGMQAWETSARPVARTHTLDTPGVCHRLDEGAIMRVLDIRGTGEVEELGIEGALNIPLAELPGRLDELTDEDPIAVFCGSGRRSTIAASILERAGRHAEVVLGGTTGWSSGRCPLRGVASA